MSSFADQTRVRLHITPFSADLLDRIVPASVLPRASNISFHSIQTYPERGFGYIELPPNDAKSLRAKFNGSILRGVKVRIDEAKPEKPGMGGKRKSIDASQQEDLSKKRVKKDKKYRGKNGEGVLSGFELPSGRRVKRGWEDLNAPSRKSWQKPQPEADDLSHKRHVIKVNLPPNIPTRTTALSKSKARPPTSQKRSVTVKEFKHTTKPVAKPSSRSHVQAISYEEGIGWIDSMGTVVEKAPVQRYGAGAVESLSKAKAVESERPESTEVAGPAETDSGSSISSGSSSSSSEALSDSELDNDSDDSSDLGDNVSETDSVIPGDTSGQEVTSRSSSPGSPSPPADEHSPPKEIHPLEALFKRAPATAEPGSKAFDLAPIETSFSFFGNGRDDEDDGTDHDSNTPRTPYSKNELDSRSIRSAAPTPDAAIGKRFTFPVEQSESPHDDREELEDMLPDAATSKDARASIDGSHEESEFRRWFYNSRGDLNRGWKRRRREEKKLKRQRESRRLGRKLA